MLLVKSFSPILMLPKSCRVQACLRVCAYVAFDVTNRYLSAIHDRMANHLASFRNVLRQAVNMLTRSDWQLAYQKPRVAGDQKP